MGTCVREGCGRSAAAKGLCRRHYYQERNGWVERGTVGMNDVQKMDFYTDKSGECWEWKGAKNLQGYGKLKQVCGKIKAAHRLAWELANGEIPPGKLVLHRCDNPGCVRPSHLFVGTHVDNHRDMIDKGRSPHVGKDRPPRNYARGEAHPYAKLTDAQVLEVEAATGTQRAIAERFGVTQGAVSNIRTGKSPRSSKYKLINAR